MEKRVVGIGASPEKALSKHQKEFNRLTEQIAEARAAIKQSTAAIEVLQRRTAGELQPLLQRENEVRADLVRLFDRKSRVEGLTKTERKKLSDVIVDMAFELIDEEGMDDLKPIFDQHNDVPFDEMDAETDDIAGEMMRAMMRAMGMEVDADDDFSTEEKRRAFFEKQEKASTERAESARQAAEERAQKRPKSAKQREKESKKQEEEAKTTKSVREVYLDLVKTFHPDREPNEAEKLRKTEIMKRVTAAYEDNDLLGLLELQLELARTDQRKLDEMPDDQLARFCKVLKQQLQELEREKWAIESRLPIQRRRQKGQLVPLSEELDRLVERDLKTMKKTIKGLQAELAAFEDLRELKAFLKQYRTQKANEFWF